MSNLFSTQISDEDFVKNIRGQLVGIYNNFLILKNSIDDKEDWDSLAEIANNIGNILSFVIEIVTAGKQLGVDVDSIIINTEKRNALVNVLDDMIKLGTFAEMADGFIIQQALDYIADVYITKLRSTLMKLISV